MARKEYETSVRQRFAIQVIESVGANYKPRWWGPSEKAERIYLDPPREGATVYLRFQEPDRCEGGEIMVWVNQGEGGWPEVLTAKENLRLWAKVALDAINRSMPEEEERDVHLDQGGWR